MYAEAANDDAMGRGLAGSDQKLPRSTSFELLLCAFGETGLPLLGGDAHQLCEWEMMMLKISPARGRDR